MCSYFPGEFRHVRADRKARKEADAVGRGRETEPVLRRAAGGGPLSGDRRRRLPGPLAATQPQRG